jgi:hypothetical protein
MEKISVTLYKSIYYEYINNNIKKKYNIKEYIKINSVKNIKEIKKIIVKNVDDDFYKNELIYKIINLNPEDYYKIFKDIIKNKNNIFFCIVYDLKFLILWFWNRRKTIPFLYNISLLYISAYYKRNDIVKWFYYNKMIYLNNGGILQCALLSNNLELLEWYYDMYKITRCNIYKLKNNNRGWAKIQIGNTKLNKELEDLQTILQNEKRTDLLEFVFKYSNTKIMDFFWNNRKHYKLKFQPFYMITSCLNNNKDGVFWYNKRIINRYDERLYNIYFKYKYYSNIYNLYSSMIQKTTNYEIKEFLYKKMKNKKKYKNISTYIKESTKQSTNEFNSGHTI